MTSTELLKRITTLVANAAVKKTGLVADDLKLDIKIQVSTDEENEEPVRVIVEELESCIQIIWDATTLEEALEEVHIEAEELS